MIAEARQGGQRPHSGVEMAVAVAQGAVEAPVGVEDAAAVDNVGGEVLRQFICVLAAGDLVVTVQRPNLPAPHRRRVRSQAGVDGIERRPAFFCPFTGRIVPGIPLFAGNALESGAKLVRRLLGSFFAGGDIPGGKPQQH